MLHSRRSGPRRRRCCRGLAAVHCRAAARCRPARAVRTDTDTGPAQPRPQNFPAWLRSETRAGAAAAAASLQHATCDRQRATCNMHHATPPASPRPVPSGRDPPVRTTCPPRPPQGALRRTPVASGCACRHPGHCVMHQCNPLSALRINPTGRSAPKSQTEPGTV